LPSAIGPALPSTSGATLPSASGAAVPSIRSRLRRRKRIADVAEHFVHA
jgi:hypothetical protein